MTHVTESPPTGQDRHAIEDEYNAHDASFRRHYQLNYNLDDPNARPYEFYAPAYRFGYELAEEHSGVQWHEALEQAKHHWQAKHTSDWEEIADAVYYGWQENRNPEALRVDHS